MGFFYNKHLPHLSCETTILYLVDLLLLGEVMDEIDQMEEDQLIEYALRLSIQDTCKFPLLGSIDRYPSNMFFLHF